MSRYGIIINLDYESHPHENIKFIWETIKDSMIENGFRCEGRMFTIDLPEKEACDLARNVLESIENHLEYERKRIYNYLKEFYGFDMTCTVNLLLPPMDNIQVEEG